MSTDADAPSAEADPPEDLSSRHQDFLPETNTTTTRTTSITARNITNQALDFFSNASNETLGACFVGLGATTYLVLGRVGLVLIGVVGGVVLHASWENSNDGESVAIDARAKENRRRREVGLDVVRRVLDWRENKSKEDDDNEIEERLLAAGKEADFASFAPATREALASFTDAVIRDYVKWWYGPILPEDISFPIAARKTLTSFILSISSHISRQRPADTFLDFLTNSSSILIVFLSELSGALSSSSPSLLPAESIQEYLEANPHSSLANILDEKNQKQKLEMVAEDILQSFLDPRTFNCEPARVFLKEILAGVILEMTIQSCSDPEWINEWIIYLLEDGDPELLNVIDAGVSLDTNKMMSNAGPADAAHSELADAQRNGTANSERERTKRLSKAEDAMEEAMLEAKRLSQLMADEDARRSREQGLSTEKDSDPPQMASDSENLPSELKDVEEAIVSPSTPGTPPSSAAAREESPGTANQASHFTSFDQILPSQAPTALQASNSALPSPPIIAAPFTLLNAKVSIFDDSTPSEKGVLRSKPTADYLIQIEPASSSHSGWMLARKYSDFEELHETLRRISAVTGAKSFVERNPILPQWKGQTKPGLCTGLENYVGDALRFRPLAESERMKKFFAKDQGLGPASPSPGGKGGLAWANPAGLENVGKGMLNVLASAPKGASAGGQALLGGVSGVFGTVGSLGQRRSATFNDGKSPGGRRSGSVSTVSLEKTDNANNLSRLSRDGRTSQDSLGSTPSLQTASFKPKPSLDRGASFDRDTHINTTNGKSSTDLSQTSSFIMETPDSSPSQEAEQEEIHLPPPPSEMPDNFDSPGSPSVHRRSTSQAHLSTVSGAQPSANDSAPVPDKVKPNSSRAFAPISDAETRMAVSLLFALLTELYTLSATSAFRRTLLTAAKTYFLRPGPNNASLDAIRLLLQDSVIETNSTDAGIASHIRKMRENALPTMEETEAWEKEKERERVRDGSPDGTKERIARRKERAKKLLMERGVPQALRGVMGAAATGEALGRVWDCLQAQRVARGLVFGVMLQGIRALTQ
ncbi:MAG: hypothetical protein M4579_000344 [Chaenotheca gracillima]|nr:MAG: hypothetical protein M4579_000344 [Chaenotheca gracillima]